jgi:Na+/H+ antiporter NhaB
MTQDLPDSAPQKQARKRRQAWVVLAISGGLLVLALALGLVIPIWQMNTVFTTASTSPSVSADEVATSFGVALMTLPYGLVLGLLGVVGVAYATVILLRTDG